MTISCSDATALTLNGVPVSEAANIPHPTFPDSGK
jgi:hypothetical protein